MAGHHGRHINSQIEGKIGHTQFPPSCSLSSSSSSSSLQGHRNSSPWVSVFTPRRITFFFSKNTKQFKIRLDVATELLICAFPLKWHPLTVQCFKNRCCSWMQLGCSSSYAPKQSKRRLSWYRNGKLIYACSKHSKSKIVLFVTPVNYIKSFIGQLVFSTL